MTAAVRQCEENLKITLADCAAFRTLVGAANRAAALTEIYLDTLPAPADGGEHTAAELIALRPYAIIETEEHQRDAVAVGASVERGRLRITIAADITGDDLTSNELARSNFYNVLGDIADQLYALGQQAGAVDSYLVIANVRAEPVSLYDEREGLSKGPHVWGVINVTHGEGG